MTKKKPLTLICVQPAMLYYAWQIEILLTNFVELGLDKKYEIRCLFAYNKKEKNWQQNLEWVQKVERKFFGNAKFYYYQDTRVYPIAYISSIRPNILKQHFLEHEYLKDHAIFYHDSDIIFSKNPDFLDNLLENDMNWYVSDTIGYIAHHYIVSKGEDILESMCKIVGINPDLVEQKFHESGGAQYLMKGVDWQFFDKMEKDSEKMYRDISKMNFEKIKELGDQYHPIQIWCADMWCLIWQAWMRGYTTNIIDELKFTWATDSIDKFYENYVYHNAGITATLRDKYFYKADYREQHPYLAEHDLYEKDKACWKYVELIKSIAPNSCLL
jgi:hypothetical protein